MVSQQKLEASLISNWIVFILLPGKTIVYGRLSRLEAIRHNHKKIFSKTFKALFFHIKNYF